MSGRIDVSIVVAQLRQQQMVPFDLIDHPVFGIDAARPVTRQREPQRLRLADAGERIARRVLDQFVDAPRDLFVRLLSVLIILPRLLRENQLHASSVIFRSRPRPFSRLPMADSKRRAFVGLRSK